MPNILTAAQVAEIEVLRKGYLNLWKAWKAHCEAGFLADLDEYDDLIADARAAGIEPAWFGEKRDD